MFIQVRCEEEGGQEEENADNLRARLINRQTELTGAQDRIREILADREMLRYQYYLLSL